MCKCFLVVVVVVVKVHMHVESVPCTAELRTTRIRTVSYSCMVYSVGGTYAIRTPAVWSIVRAVCCAACPTIRSAYSEKYAPACVQPYKRPRVRFSFAF